MPGPRAFDADKSESMVSPDMPINFRGASGDIADNEEHQRAYPWYEVSLENTSPGGYCINWDADMPVSPADGRDTGVREHEDHPWSIALIRWIRQAGKRGTQLGVELLAPGATPARFALTRKSATAVNSCVGSCFRNSTVSDSPPPCLRPACHSRLVTGLPCCGRPAATGTAQQAGFNHQQHQPVRAEIPSAHRRTRDSTRSRGIGRGRRL